MKNWKRILSLLLVLTMCFSLLPLSAFAGDGEGEPCEHEPAGAVTENAVAPTCTEPGSHDEVVYCSLCGEELSRETVEDSAPGHTPEDVPEVPAEPGKPGKTEGVVCSVCGEVLEGCEAIPALPTGETEPEDETVITIKTQPKDAEPKEGTAEFSVSAEVSTEAELAYQWQRLDESAEYENDEARAAAWEDIEGETGAELRLEKLDDPDALAEAAKYAYRCVLTAGETEAVTDEARLRKPASAKKGPVRSPEPTVVCSYREGSGITWTLYDNGSLEISGNGAMQTAAKNANNIQDHLDEIIQVTVQSGVTSLSQDAFSDCPNLSGFTLDSSVITIGNSAFKNCSSLSAADIPDTVQTILPSAFENCSACTKVTIPASVTLIGGQVFKGCTSLTAAGPIDSGKSIEFGWMTALPENAFSDCSSLTSVTLPEDLATIGANAFFNCESLTSIGIPATVSEIGAYAFYSCKSLEEVAIPAGVAAIANSTFSACSGMTAVHIPDSVTSIGDNAFATCNLLADVYYGGTLSQWESLRSSIGSNNTLLLNAQLHYLYAVVIPTTITNGTVTASINGSDVTKADEDDVVTLTVTPAAGYELTDDSLTVSYGENQTAALTQGTGENANTWTFTMPAADVTVAATFKPASYSVHYDANGGTGAPADQTKTHDVPLTLSSTVPTRANSSAGSYTVTLDPNAGSVNPTSLNAARTTGYSFAGWNTAADGSGTSYNPEASYTANAAATLYAQWNASTATAAVDLPTPTREEYTFVGWGTSADAASGVTGSYTPSDDVTFYALWEPVIVASGTCGTNQTWTLDDGVLTISGTGAMAAYSAANPAPWSAFAPYIRTVEIGSGVTRIGAFAFVGCDNIEVVMTGSMPGIAATAFSGVTAVVRYPGTSSSYTAAKKTNYGGTLEWVPEGGFQIAYDPNGGRFADGLAHTQVKYYGLAVNLSDVTPERPGYTFLGWATFANATRPNYQPGGTFTENANRTLYALWRAETYVVRFDANLEGATGAMADQTFSFGKAAALRANAFRKTGCVFLGWAFDPDAAQPDFEDKQTVTDLIAPESGERTVTLYGVWATLTTKLEIWVNPPEGEVNLTGQTLDVDMSWLDGTDLYFKTSEGSSQAVSWTSTAPAVAKVDANGHVTFLKPGTAIIKVSATDGSRLSASVKFNVYYITPAQRLTARLADTTGEYGVNPGIGLQVGDRVPVEVFGSDPNTPLDPGLFQYDVVTAGGSSFLRFTTDGELESVAAGKTIAVKMTLLGDPLKRSVTLNVKTVPIQTKSVRLIPAPQTGEIDGIWFLDASGEPTDSYEQAAAIYMPSSNTARRLTLVPFPTDVNGDEMTLAANSFSCATTSAAVASVSPIRSGDELGCISVTIPARATGACTVTATSTDLAKASASISIYVADYAPRTDVTRVTLDTFDPDGGAVVPLVLSYGNTITGVSFLDAGYDRANSRYTESTGRIEAELVDGGSGEVSAVIRSGRGIPNAVINGQLCIRTDKGEFYLPLTVACKSPAPQIKITQQRAFNVFYANETVPFGWSSSDSWISNIELESEDFESCWSNGHDLSIRFRDGRASAAPNVKAALKVYFGNNTYPNGAKHPYEIPITISAVTQRPALKLEKSTFVYNLQHGTAKIGLGILDSSGTRYTLSDDTDIWLSDNSFAEMQVEDGQPCVVVTNPDSAGGRLTLYLQEANWTSPLSFPLTLTRTGAVPTLSVKPATVILNSNWPDTTVYTSVVSNQANTDIDLSTAVITAPRGMEDKLTFTSGYVPLDGGEITLSSAGGLSPQEPISGSAPSAGIENEAGRSGFLGVRIAAGKQVPNGTYKYTFKPEGLPAFTMNVQVVNTLPTLRLQTPTLTLGGFNGDWFWENNDHSTAHAYTGFSLSNPEMPVSSFQFTSVGANAAEAESILDVAYDRESDRIHVSFRDGVSPMRTGTYVFAVKAIMEGGLALKPVNLTVKLKDDRPVCPFASSLKWNYTLNRNLPTCRTGVSSGFIGTDFTISVDAECSSASAAVRAEAQKIGYSNFFDDADDSGIRTHYSIFYLNDQPAVGSYPFNLWPKWTQNGYTLVYKPVPVTVKVENSLPKVSLTSPTLVLNRQVALSGVSFVNIQSNFDPRYSNVEYSFVGFREIMDGTYGSSEYVTLTTDAKKNSLKATLTGDGRDAARNEDYRITLTPVVTDGYMDVTCAPITLTVRNTSTAARTATVSLSGKLDTVLRNTDAGRMTLTLTSFNGVQGAPDDVELAGPDAELFTLVGGGVNARGQFFTQLSLRDDLSYRANVSYGGLQLRLHYPDGTEVDSQKFSVRVTQSAIKLSSPQATKTFYQSQSRSRWVNYVVDVQTPNGAAIGSIEVGDIRIWQNALKDMASNIDFSVSGNSAVVRVRLADTSKLVAGRTYTLPLLVTPAASADNVAPTRINLTLSVKK